MTIPIKEIIPREIPTEVKPILDLFSTLLEEFVNFGSHILAWDDPKTKGDDTRGSFRAGCGG